MSAIERAEQLARQRYGRLTPFRMGLVAKDAQLTFNPYPHGSHKAALFAQGAEDLPTLWPCGHPRTSENTQSIGVAGVRCRECRRRISLESYNRRKGENPARFRAASRKYYERNREAILTRLAEKRAKARGEQ